MKLVNLSLQGFRQHLNSFIEFKPGLTGIIGPNGAGKTTLVEAIAFALFGSKAVRGKVEDIKSRTLRSSAELKVALSFEHEGVVYRVERGIDDALLFIGGEGQPAVRGNRDVVAKISALLRMNYEEFTATFLTEQKGLEFLSGKKGATERERFIVRMMGYDRLERVQEILRNERRDKKNAIAGGEASLGQRNDLLARIEREEQDLNLVQEKHDEAQRVLEKAEKEVGETRAHFERMQTVYEIYAKQKQRISEKTVRYEEAAKRAQSLEKQISQQAGVQKSLKEIHNILLEIAPGAAWPAACESQLLIQMLENQMRELSAQKRAESEKLQQSREAWREKSVSLQGQYEMRRAQRDALLARGQKFNELDPSGACPTCGQELGESFSSVKLHFENELTEADKNLSAIKEQYETAAKEPERLKNLIKSLQDLTQRAEVLEAQAKKLTQMESMLRESERVRQELASVRCALGELHQELEADRKTLSELRFSEDEFRQARTQYDNTQRLLEVSRLQRVKLEGESNTKQALLERSKQTLQEYDIKSRMLDETRKELVLFDESDQILIDFRRYLNAQLRPRLSELASEFLSELTDGRYIAVEIASDFTPTLLEDGQPKAVISGGEEDLLNLCVRLALSNMLAERAGQAFSLLILDEVFGSLDESRRTNVLLLLDRLSSRFEQILVITHLEDIREGVQNLLSVNYDETTAELQIIDAIGAEENSLVINL